MLIIKGHSGEFHNALQLLRSFLGKKGSSFPQLIMANRIGCTFRFPFSNSSAQNMFISNARQENQIERNIVFKKKMGDYFGQLTRVIRQDLMRCKGDNVVMHIQVKACLRRTCLPSCGHEKVVNEYEEFLLYEQLNGTEIVYDDEWEELMKENGPQLKAANSAPLMNNLPQFSQLSRSDTTSFVFRTQ